LNDGQHTGHQSLYFVPISCERSIDHGDLLAGEYISASADPAAHAPEQEVSRLVVAAANHLKIRQIRLDKRQRTTEVTAAFLDGHNSWDFAQLDRGIKADLNTHPGWEVVHDDGQRRRLGDRTEMSYDFGLPWQAIRWGRKHKAVIAQCQSLAGALARTLSRHPIDARNHGDPTFGHLNHALKYVSAFFFIQSVVFARRSAGHNS